MSNRIEQGDILVATWGFKAEMQTRYEITARQIVWTEED